MKEENKKSLICAIFFIIVALAIVFATSCSNQPAVLPVYESPIPVVILPPSPSYPCTYYETVKWYTYKAASKNIKSWTTQAKKDCAKYAPPCHDRYTCTQKRLGLGPYKDYCSDDLQNLDFNQRNKDLEKAGISDKCWGALTRGWQIPPDRIW